MTLKEALKEAIASLAISSTSARIDAEALLSFVLKKERNYFYTYPEKVLSHEEETQFKALVGERLKGIPIAYLTNEREFWSLTLKVNEDTLIPRPETELLVELCLNELQEKKQGRVLELGTGSGAIALALKKEMAFLEIIAVDKSEKALNIAKENAKRLQLDSICFAYSDWYSEIDKNLTFDIIVTNPPYIANNDPHLNEGDLRFEPMSALASGEKGLDAIEHIIKQGLARLKPKGLLLIEHGFDQKALVQSMLNKYGYKKVETWQDCQALDRVTGGRRYN